MMNPDGFGQFSLSLHVENYRDSEPGYLEVMFHVTDYTRVVISVTDTRKNAKCIILIFIIFIRFLIPMSKNTIREKQLKYNITQYEFM